MVSTAAVPACPCMGRSRVGEILRPIYWAENSSLQGVYCFRAHGDLSVLVNSSFGARVQFWTQSSAFTALMKVLGAKDCVGVVVRKWSGVTQTGARAWFPACTNSVTGPAAVLRKKSSRKPHG